MRSPLVDDRVRLTKDIPELALLRGEVGVVRSTWFAPSVAYEVEFHLGESSLHPRTLLRADQVEIDDEADRSADGAAASAAMCVLPGDYFN